MNSRQRLCRLLFAFCLVTPALAATPPNATADLGTSDGDIGRAPLGGARNDLPVQGGRPAARPPFSANPLWAVPLSTLTATRERPLFSPTRRAPAPVVANAPIVAQPPPPAPAMVEHPDLILVGTVTGETQSLAVFVEPATHKTVRLLTGQDHRGWILQSVEGKSATLHKGTRTETLVLPPPSATSAPTPVISALPPAPPPPPQQAAPQPVRAAGEPAQAAPQLGGCMPEPVGC
jgi:general secretion pathway protein N